MTFTPCPSVTCPPSFFSFAFRPTLPPLKTLSPLWFAFLPLFPFLSLSLFHLPSVLSFFIFLSLPLPWCLFNSGGGGLGRQSPPGAPQPVAYSFYLPFPLSPFAPPPSSLRSSSRQRPLTGSSPPHLFLIAPPLASLLV